MINFKIFLGGTVNSNWRDKLIPLLELDYFNPIVEEWNEKARINEEKEKNESEYQLYVITPRQEGFYTIAELVESANNEPSNTLLCILKEDKGKKWNDTYNSVLAVKELVAKKGVKTFTELKEVAKYVNTENREYKRIMNYLDNNQYYKLWNQREVIHLFNQNNLSLETFYNFLQDLWEIIHEELGNVIINLHSGEDITGIMIIIKITLSLEKRLNLESTIIHRLRDKNKDYLRFIILVINGVE